MYLSICIYLYICVYIYNMCMCVLVNVYTVYACMYIWIYTFTVCACVCIFKNCLLKWNIDDYKHGLRIMQCTLTCLTLLSWEIKCHIQLKPTPTTTPNLLPPQFLGVTTLINLLFIIHKFTSLHNMQYGLAFLTLHKWYQSECIILWLAYWTLCFQYIIFIEVVDLQHCVSSV